MVRHSSVANTWRRCSGSSCLLKQQHLCCCLPHSESTFCFAAAHYRSGPTCTSPRRPAPYLLSFAETVKAFLAVGYALVTDPPAKWVDQSMAAIKLNGELNAVIKAKEVQSPVQKREHWYSWSGVPHSRKLVILRQQALKDGLASLAASTKTNNNGESQLREHKDCDVSARPVASGIYLALLVVRGRWEQGEPVGTRGAVRRAYSESPRSRAGRHCVGNLLSRHATCLHSSSYHHRALCSQQSCAAARARERFFHSRPPASLALDNDNMMRFCSCASCFPGALQAAGELGPACLVSGYFSMRALSQSARVPSESLSHMLSHSSCGAHSCRTRLRIPACSKSTLPSRSRCPACV